jgi:hypothetical protein
LQQLVNLSYKCWRVKRRGFSFDFTPFSEILTNMPKAIDLRVPGLRFEDALRKVFRTQPMPTARGVQKSAKKPRRKSKI